MEATMIQIKMNLMLYELIKNQQGFLTVETKDKDVSLKLEFPLMGATEDLVKTLIEQAKRFKGWEAKDGS